MRRIISLGFVLLVAVSQTIIGSTSVSRAFLSEFGANSRNAFPQSNPRVRHRRRVRGDFGRRRHRGIKHEYKESGLSVGHGGRRFGKHMKHGRLLHAGGAFGRGMGGFGKHVGKGTARVGKRIVKH
ncbi:MAG TPA: hypothetical protein VN951_01270 [Pyrinomonadaceae bacterium]|nr:hypothetical protein [Pyrinomonadaceae bacterium]